ncbi:hypothetical protein [Streptomyces sp. NPDC048332]|uniref:hypothetical protein n=1 Tax=Streptomyces sp. NPDC048332 TaxID=3154619 RepID=UPI003440BBC9
MLFGRTAARALCVAALTLGTACSLAAREEAPQVAEGDMPGHWKGTCGATIDLAAAGTYEFRDFPTEDEAGGRPRLISGKGGWTLLDSAGRTEPELELEGEKEFYSLSFAKDGDGFKLHQWVGDPDDGNDCTYTR